MATYMKPADGEVTLNELREFASFDAASQRYIRRSLDVAFDRTDAINVWARDVVESASIRAQTKVYTLLPQMRNKVPVDNGLDQLDPFMGILIRVAAFDLSQDRLSSFGGFRFLFERLIGAQVRPWLPSAFCAAASLPNFAPEKRRTLLQSISEAAAMAPGWSQREPIFFPEWVELVDIDAR